MNEVTFSHLTLTALQISALIRRLHQELMIRRMRFFWDGISLLFIPANHQGQGLPCTDADRRPTAHLRPQGLVLSTYPTLDLSAHFINYGASPNRLRPLFPHRDSSSEYFEYSSEELTQLNLTNLLLGVVEYAKEQGNALARV
jgi:hypothetical protein